jgi:2-polyprenyl-6-methoxyphenol hydroxylase-like FAD-dependent oxidoreductase
MQREDPSGLDVLVIGGGIAGLGFAIEAYRKGHNVTLIERRPDFNDYGMFFFLLYFYLASLSMWERKL